MNKIRVGIIGLGIGRHHIMGYQKHPQVEVVALCDPDRKRLETVAAEFGVSHQFTDATVMLKKMELDAVSIATPNKFHAPQTIAALKAGLHVLCEKPMAMNSQEAEEMLAAARKAKKNLMINFSYRFNEMSFSLKKQVDAGLLGDVYFGRTVWHRRRGIPGLGGWFTNKEMSGGGPLIDLGVHRLDLALWLMGYPEPFSVSGAVFDHLAQEIARNVGKSYTVEDLATGMVRFTNGAVLIVESSWALNIKENEQMVTMLCGTKGGLLQKNIGGTYNFSAEFYTEENGNLYTKTLDRSLVPAPSPYQEFANSILENRPPLATGEEGLKVLKIIEALYQSAQNHREVYF